MLSNNTDYQNNLLNRLAYCDLKKGMWKSGDDLITVLNENGYKQLADELSLANMKSLKIRDYTNNNDASGFVAIAFEDYYTGECGMSFRGTENLPEIIPDFLSYIKGNENVINKQIDMIDNISTAMTGDSHQVQEAIDFYKKNRNENGSNFLYGHSKGGELASEVFSENYYDIKQVHVINPQPILWTSLTPEQIKVFNSDKFDATVVNGDLVWLLGGVPYSVRIIENNKTGDKFFSPHDLTSAKYNDDTGMAIIEDYPYIEYIPQGLFGAVATVMMSCAQVGYTIGKELWLAIEELQEFLVKKVPEAAQKTYELVVLMYEKTKDFVSEVKHNINDFIGKMGYAVKTWYNNNFNAGYTYFLAHPHIVVDTYKLQRYAERLQAVNNRVSKLDSRLDNLYWKVGLKDLWSLMQADMLTGYSWRITRCVSYLNDTASDFEKVESELQRSL